MNYGKKDEDAENGLVKVDRTQVFQEGELAHIDIHVASITALGPGDRSGSKYIHTVR